MKKILVLGVIAVLLSAGLVLASCDDGPCCDKGTMEAMGKGTKPPDCCVDALAMAATTLDYGCCESAVKEYEKS